jgi:hypothetical protein
MQGLLFWLQNSIVVISNVTLYINSHSLSFRVVVELVYSNRPEESSEWAFVDISCVENRRTVQVDFHWAVVDSIASLFSLQSLSRRAVRH